MPSKGDQAGVRGERLALPIRRWRRVAFVWGLYFLSVATVGRFEDWMQRIIWYGGGFVGCVTLLEWHRSGGQILREVKLLVGFLLVAAAGYGMAIDESAYLEHLKLAMEFALLVAFVGVTVARAGSARWLWIAFILATGFNLREEIVNPPQTRAPVVVGVSGQVQERAEGRTGNANALGYMAFAGAFGSLALARSRKERRWWPVLAAAGVVCVYTLLLTASRGAFVALALTVVLWAVRCLPVLIGRKTGRSVLVAGALFVSLYGLRVALGGTYLGARMTSGTSGEDSSANVRGELFLAALRLLAESPVFGVGLGQFPIASGTGYYAHNELAELLGTVGLLGTGLFYAMYFVCWRGLSRIDASRLGQGGRYDLEITKTLLIVLMASGVLFRPNFLSIDSMFLIAVAVGLRHGLEAVARTARLRAPLRGPASTLGYPSRSGVTRDVANGPAGIEVSSA